MTNQLPEIPMERSLLERCVFIAEVVKRAGGEAYLVGGCVRDAILKIPPKDVDIEVFGLESEKLEALLKEYFSVSLVGKAFGVLKIKGHEIDVSLPRRESKHGSGHRGFHVESDPHMSFEAAASRRDFTINAMGWNPLTGELVDPFHGQSDLINGVLRHTSEKFSEDPLRVLRGMQFVARFGLKAVPETIKLCQSMTSEGIAGERFFEEWRKLMTKGVHMSAGLNFLKDTHWLKYYPELEALVGCEQDAKWHPEGDVWTHTCLAMDAFGREKTGDAWEDLVVGFAVLCHDMGKPDTSFTDEEGHIRSPKHDQVGVPIAERFLRRITQHGELIESVLPLVREHMQALALWRDQCSDAAVRRLARRIGRIDRLVRVDSADRGGRGDVFTEPSPQGAWLLERAQALAVMDSAPKPIILGRHLIEHGLKPSRAFKDILNACFEAQTEGVFNDDASAQAFLKDYLASLK